MQINNDEVLVSADDIAAFNKGLAFKRLPVHPYKFKFDRKGNIINTSCELPINDSIYKRLVNDCMNYMFLNIRPQWAQNFS